MNQQELVMPGDRLGVEEEYTASDNTFIDESDGSIRSSIAGYVSINEGKISVHNPERDIRLLNRGMLILGTVTDDVKAVMFVKIDSIRTKNGEYLALKDGKIVMPPKRRPERGRRFGRDGGEERHEEKPEQEPERESKPCGVGDVIIAKIFYEDPDIYTLSVTGPESGVVHSSCELCNSEMDAKGQDTLVCRECQHTQKRKVSSLYNQPEAIKRLFA